MPDELIQLRAENARLRVSYSQVESELAELRSREMDADDIADYTESIQRLQVRVTELEGLLREAVGLFSIGQCEVAHRAAGRRKEANALLREHVRIVNKIDAALNRSK